MDSDRLEYLFEFLGFMSEAELRREAAEISVDTREMSLSEMCNLLRNHHREALIELRRKNPYRRRTCKFYNYFIVIDFECNCEENNYDFEHEIIEFPALLISVESRKVVDKFHTFVRPTINPKLSEFCMRLTGVTQEVVDNAPAFSLAIEYFRGWMGKHGLDGVKGTGNARRFCYVTDGPWDIGKFLQMEFLRNGQAPPHEFRCFLNMRRSFINFYSRLAQHSFKCDGQNVKTCSESAKSDMLFPEGVTLAAMLQHLGLQFKGREHCGLDDAENIARIVIQMMEDGAELRVNEKLVRADCVKSWQKLVFDEHSKAPSCVVPCAPLISLLDDADDGEEEHGQGAGTSSQGTANIDKKDEKTPFNLIVWKKWWDEMPYKLVRISKDDFLGERHLECESCDEQEGW